LSRKPLDPALVSAAVYANSFRTVQRAARATGLRTYALRQDALRHAGDHRVAEEFLVNSRLRRRDIEFESSVGAYFTEAGATMASLIGRSARQNAQAISLPAPLPLPMAVSEAIQRRRSVRTYTGESVPLDYVATLAVAADGVTQAAGEGGADMALRSTPSAGALYPVELWLAALRVDDLARGVYAHDAQRQELLPVGDETAVDGLMASLAVAEDVVMCSQAALLCVYVARPWRSMRKYGPRGMRHVFLEAGAMAEQVNLAAVALGLGGVDCSSVYDDEAHEALGVDGVYEAIVHAQVLGTPV
jgi:SagB-type dehydrogenase family enzyme